MRKFLVLVLIAVMPLIFFGCGSIKASNFDGLETIEEQSPKQNTYTQYFFNGATHLQMELYREAVKNLEKFANIDILYIGFENSLRADDILEEQVLFFNVNTTPNILGNFTWFRQCGDSISIRQDLVIWLKIYT